jgi:RNA polymerase II C-terminal domain phosphatase-like 3/4
MATQAGRAGGRPKASNQDAFMACPLPASGGAPPALLLSVFDGHGRGGETAAETAAGGLAGAVPAVLSQLQAGARPGLVPGLSSDGAPHSGSGGGGGQPPLAQRALVRAFQAVAASMAYDCDFQSCGTAALACIVEPGRWALAGAHLLL